MDGVSWSHAFHRMWIHRRGQIPRDPTTDWQYINIREMEQARRVIQFSRDQPWKLRHLLAGDCYDVRLMTDSEVSDRIAVMLLRGELLLLGERGNSSLQSSAAVRSTNEVRTTTPAPREQPSKEPVFASSAGAPQARSINEIAKGRAQVPRPTHWIEIELVGEDDKPIPFAAYDMKLPDGTETHGYLDGDGFARLDDMPESGSCAVRFPELDRDAWESIATLSAPRASN